MNVALVRGLVTWCIGCYLIVLNCKEYLEFMIEIYEIFKLCTLLHTYIRRMIEFIHSKVWKIKQPFPICWPQNVSTIENYSCSKCILR